MTNQFLISYVSEQFGFIPSRITEAMRNAAEVAWSQRR